MNIQVTSADEMRAIEAAANEAGISYQTMMERAGQAAADRAVQLISHLDDPRVTVLVGPGNNGGDGLVTGLLIKQANDAADVRFYLLSERSEDDPYIPVAQEAGLFVAIATDDSDKRVLRNMIASSDLVIDALFGIGIRLPLRDEASQVLRAVRRGLLERQQSQQDADEWSINPAQASEKHPKPSVQILAIDGPSGLDFDTGQIDTAALSADETVTFIAAKKGLLLFPGAQSVGRLTVANLGIPAKLKELKSIETSLLDASTVSDILPARNLDSNKGTFGKAMIVAGSVNYVGAANLSAQAAYRSGVGLVSVATARPVAAILAPVTPEATWVLLPHDMGVISEAAVEMILEEIENYKAMLIGPGMGQEETTQHFLFQLLGHKSRQSAPKKRNLGFAIAVDDTASKDDEATKLPPLVIDADGLNMLSKEDKWWDYLPENTILTPHPGEMARLAGSTVSDVQGDRFGIVKEKSKEWNTIIVLKGAHTLVAAPDGRITALPFKNDALATAGTGDVLAGIIVSLLAQDMEPYKAACAGAYIHGLAGEFAAQEHGSRSLIASDVIATLGKAFKALSPS